MQDAPIVVFWVHFCTQMFTKTLMRLSRKAYSRDIDNGPIVVTKLTKGEERRSDKCHLQLSPKDRWMTTVAMARIHSLPPILSWVLTTIWPEPFYIKTCIWYSLKDTMDHNFSPIKVIVKEIDEHDMCPLFLRSHVCGTLQKCISYNLIWWNFKRLNHHPPLVENYVEKYDNRFPIVVLLTNHICCRQTIAFFSFLFFDKISKTLGCLIHCWNGIFNIFPTVYYKPLNS